MPKSGKSGAVLRCPFARSRKYRGETMVGLTRVTDCVRNSLVITETADAASWRGHCVHGGYRGNRACSVGERLRIDNFSRRFLAISARDPHDTVPFTTSRTQIDRVAERVSFGELNRNIGRTASLLRAHGIGRNDVVAILMPAVPAIYWSILGAMSLAFPFP